MFIRLEGVAVTYPNGAHGLHRTEIGFAASDMTILVGPSGAGKSTLLRTLNMLVAPSAGEVSVEGIGAIRRGPALRRHRRGTAMIFQQHQLLPRLTALQNVMIARLARYPGWRTLLPLPESEKRWGLECLDRVGLLDKALERCDALSGGQQQRVGIARALAQEPRLVLADEPVASVDPASAAHILGMLRDICREDGIPAIVSLHQLDLAKSFGDRIVGLAEGRIVFDGPPEALTAPQLIRIYGALPDPDEAGGPPARHGRHGSLDEPRRMEARG